MKLIILFLGLGLLKANANVFSQTITFSGKDVELTKVFTIIEKQTGYTVFANKGLLRDAKPVTLSVTNAKLDNFLELLFKDQPVNYEINDRTIFLKEKNVSTVNNAATLPPPAIALIKITGVVTNAEKTPLEGATVAIKNKQGAATFTKNDGSFTINAEPNQILVISYVGYATQEVPIDGRTSITIVLKSAEKEIEGVVVTALGIKKQARAVSYNVQELAGDEVTKVKDANFVNSLAGKIAGATINASSAGTGSSSRVVMRGVKSISGNNNALYVIDGIPMPNNVRGQAEDIFSGAGQTGDFVSNLNSDDIESISVLSGPSAAALYGSAAANGVIMITTKKGTKNRMAISVSNSTMFSNPLLLPKFQNTYGQSDVGSYYSWGDKLNTPSSYEPADFFQTGMNTTTGVTLSAGSDRSQTYVSLGNVTSHGIVPNNNYGRTNFTARNTTTFLNDKLTMDVSFMTGLVNEQNMISQGQYFNPLVAVYLFPPGDDFNRVKAFERYDPSRNMMTQFWPYGDNGLTMQNPYWVTQRDLFQNKKERYMTSLSLKYNINSWMNISARAKMDKDNEKNEKKFAASTNTLFASNNGYYSLNNLDTRQIYGDVLLNINKAISNHFNLTANIGASIEDVQYNQDLYGGKLLGVANLYSYANVDRSLTDVSQTGYHKQKQSVFASAQLGYKSKIYLDVTARNDWASTLAESTSQSFFYPSVGLSGILTDLLPIKSDVLNYLKLRTSYSAVGNEPDPFLTIPTYALAGGYPRTQIRLPNPDLKPELTKSLEVGLNVVLFKGALKIDATAYSSRTFNQYFEPSLSSTSGSESVIVNGGRIDNKGLEATVRYSTKFNHLNWSTYVNYSLNRNKVVELLPGWTNPLTGQVTSLHELDMSGTGSYKMVLKEGGSMGDIYVNTLRVDEHGAYYVDPGSQKVIAEPNKFVYAGNNNPLYNVGWGNDLKYKGINLNFLFTARVGGIVVSNTQAIMDAFGVSKASADARDAGGAMLNGYKVPAKDYYSTIGAGATGGIASMYTYDATNVRLAELVLGYDFPVTKWTSFLKGANVSFIGRNLLMLYNKAPFDPELTANTQTYFQGIDYFMMPSLRSYGFSVKLNF
ncbi:SusC/RagA family TonB-linked outer membrane protein [Pinibacter soli]|uniref:SusC/RagA family TonB-linked outer membrane protein n=1 Tax=Pinibacter soli TaxID=3044211 RepID=A0ABT6R891_9BACT|nr:SusC/RagA family TonB-linked outer membrane protein [Pinibacter soli]MDI3318137.1 SusC/RagA family TonB-linked outer membrane protein [Pinibacter soli]